MTKQALLGRWGGGGRGGGGERLFYGRDLKDRRKIRIALMHVYVTQANFTTKPRFEIKNKRSFTEMNSQGSRVEKNTHAQKVQMQKILFTNEACW